MSGRNVIVCRSGELRVGILVKDVVEVLRMLELAPLPGLPAYYLGAFDYRGTMIAAVDLNRRLRLAPASPEVPDYDRHLVVLGPPHGEAAVAVDRVLDLFHGDDAPPVEGGPDPALFAGFVQDGFGPVPILNTERIFRTKHHLKLMQLLSQGKHEVIG